MVLARTLREGKYDSSRSFNTWIWIKARSIFAQWCRRRSRQPHALPDNVAVSGGPDVSVRADANAILDEVARQLGPETYEAFVLYYEGELNKREVAEVLGRDPKTIRKKLRQAHGLIDRLLA